ncbi:helix-turn-helix transcriptional regulator [Pendulispora brunnea]|uniref:Helix-turn-helix transcriptional regulator n=1 Tax=Pendulispora brunnea TaxID=2905690 RepID=A0ABZ2JTW5_9BACT
MSDESRLVEANDTSGAGYAFGEFRFSPTSRSLLLFEEPVRLGARAFEILRILVERAGDVVTSEELLTQVWPDVVVEETNLRVQIVALRKVLARGEQRLRSIETVPRGYRFVLPVAPWAQAVSDTPSHEHTLHNLPGLLAVTVGRAETIALLADSLAQRRLVTIAGPGGVGKTTVAIAVARQCLRRFPEGICFVDFSSLSDPSLVTSALASALGIGVIAAKDPMSGLISHLRKKEMLLVLDTCEHVVDAAAALVESLLSQLPRLRILATSREVLRAAGEWAHRLPCLPYPALADPSSAVDALEYPSVDLFVRRARASFDRFELQDADAPIVAAICRRLDGIPLAIEFAAARVGELGLREISARLDDRFDVLTHGRRKALPRHKTLAATLDWSYDLLPPEEQTLLRQLSVFRGAFTTDGAVAVAGEAWTRAATLMYLSNLFGKSLVTVDIGGETTLYRLLDTTRAFAAEKLTAAERHEASVRHARYVLASLHDAEVDYQSDDSRGWTERHRNLIDDLRGALDWALSESGDRHLALQLIGDSMLVSYALSLFGEYARRLKKLFEQMPDMSMENPATATRVWEVYGHAKWQTAEPIEAVADAFRKALDVARSAGLVEGQIRALAGLHIIFFYNGNYEESFAASKEYEVLATAVKSPAVTMSYRRMSALVLHGMGDQAAARSQAEGVLADLAGPMGKQHRAIMSDARFALLPTLARILWLQGHATQAWEYACEGLELARARGQPLPLCSVISLAMLPLSYWTGNMAAVEEFTDTLFTLSLEHSLVLAHQYGRAFRAILEGTPDTSREPVGGAFIADTAATMDARFAAEATLDRVEHGYERWCTSELLRIRAARFLVEGDAEHVAKAEALLLRSLDVAQRQQAWAWELRTAITLAEHEKGRPGYAAALDRLAAAYARFTEGFETRDLMRAAAILRDR